MSTYEKPALFGRFRARIKIGVDLASSGTNDPSQRFFQQAPIRHTLGVGALGQVVQLAPHSRQIGRLWKSDQIEVRPLILNGS
jgi:hypothetical protein